MPDRIVRAAILTSDGVCSLSWAAEVFYRRLMSVVDDYGRYDGRVSVLKSHCYPLQTDKVTDRDVGKWLSESAAAGLVTLYSVGGKPYLHVERFNQRIRSDSKWPAPEITKKPENVGSRSIDSKVLTDDSNTPQSAAVFVCVDVCEDVGACHPPNGGCDVPKRLPEVFEAWNEIKGVTHARQMTDNRKKSLRARLADSTWCQNWKPAMSRVAKSAFCTGANDSGWRADIDWFLRPDTVTKVMEGKYDDRDRTANAFGNSGGTGGKVEGFRVRSSGPGSLLDQMDKELQRAESARRDSAGGPREMQSSGPGDDQAGV